MEKINRSDLTVVYEDNHLIAVFKEAGVLTQADFRGERCLMDDVKIYLKEKYQKPGNVFLGLLHRLDRPVSGIVLFAKTSKGASRLSEQFRDRTISKTYHAIVTGIPKNKRSTLVHHLIKNEKTNTVSASEIPCPGSLAAELSYSVKSTHDGYSLLEVHPKTGRPHQIRVQLAAMGTPIVGDSKYGSKQALSDHSILLCATGLTFQTATTGETQVIEVKIPKIWQKYVQ